MKDEQLADTKENEIARSKLREYGVNDYQTLEQSELSILEEIEKEVVSSFNKSRKEANSAAKDLSYEDYVVIRDRNKELSYIRNGFAHIDEYSTRKLKGNQLFGTEGERIEALNNPKFNNLFVKFLKHANLNKQASIKQVLINIERYNKATIENAHTMSLDNLLDVISQNTDITPEDYDIAMSKIDNDPEFIKSKKEDIDNIIKELKERYNKAAKKIIYKTDKNADGTEIIATDDKGNKIIEREEEVNLFEDRKDGDEKLDDHQEKLKSIYYLGVLNDLRVDNSANVFEKDGKVMAVLLNEIDIRFQENKDRVAYNKELEDLAKEYVDYTKSLNYKTLSYNKPTGDGRIANLRRLESDTMMYDRKEYDEAKSDKTISFDKKKEEVNSKNKLRYKDDLEQEKNFNVSFLEKNIKVDLETGDVVSDGTTVSSKFLDLITKLEMSLVKSQDTGEDALILNDTKEIEDILTDAGMHQQFLHAISNQFGRLTELQRTLNHIQDGTYYDAFYKRPAGMRFLRFLRKQLVHTSEEYDLRTIDRNKENYSFFNWFTKKYKTAKSYNGEVLDNFTKGIYDSNREDYLLGKEKVGRLTDSEAKEFAAIKAIKLKLTTPTEELLIGLGLDKETAQKETDRLFGELLAYQAQQSSDGENTIKQNPFVEYVKDTVNNKLNKGNITGILSTFKELFKNDKLSTIDKSYLGTAMLEIVQQLTEAQSGGGPKFELEIREETLSLLSDIKGIIKNVEFECFNK